MGTQGRPPCRTDQPRAPGTSGRLDDWRGSVRFGERPPARVAPSLRPGCLPYTDESRRFGRPADRAIHLLLALAVFCTTGGASPLACAPTPGHPLGSAQGGGSKGEPRGAQRAPRRPPHRSSAILRNEPNLVFVFKRCFSISTSGRLPSRVFQCLPGSPLARFSRSPARFGLSKTKPILPFCANQRSLSLKDFPGPGIARSETLAPNFWGILRGDCSPLRAAHNRRKTKPILGEHPITWRESDWQKRTQFSSSSPASSPGIT